MTAVADRSPCFHLPQMEDSSPRTTHQNAPDVFPTFHVVGLQPGQRGSSNLQIAERPFHRDLVWGGTLSRTLWRHDSFREHAKVVRNSPAAAATARKLSLGYGRGHRHRGLIANLLLTAALVPEQHASQMLDFIWMRPIVDREGSPLTGAYRVGRKTVEKASRGAELIARRGAGLCVVPGCGEPRSKVAGNGAVRDYEMSVVYCADHHGDDSRHADEKIIERTFEHCIEAWPSSEERELLLWWWGKRAEQRSGGVDEQIV
jgi:hypothetical protein